MQSCRCLLGPAHELHRHTRCCSQCCAAHQLPHHLLPPPHLHTWLTHLPPPTTAAPAAAPGAGAPTAAASPRLGHALQRPRHTLWYHLHYRRARQQHRLDPPAARVSAQPGSTLHNHCRPSLAVSRRPAAEQPAGAAELCGFGAQRRDAAGVGDWGLCAAGGQPRGGPVPAAGRAAQQGQAAVPPPAVCSTGRRCAGTAAAVASLHVACNAAARSYLA